MKFNGVSMMAVALVLSLAGTVESAETADLNAATANPVSRQRQPFRLNRLRGGDNPASKAAAVAVEHPNDGKKVDPGGRSIEFNAAPLEMVFKVYSELKERTVLKDPATPAATITLQPLQGQDLTDEEKIWAIETVLEMNGIHLEPYGEKFMRAIPRKEVRKDGIPLIMDPDAELRESTTVVSLMLPFKNISIEEAQKALEGFKSGSGVLNVFERTNAILITDTEANINRMREVARAIDVATPVTENVFVRQVRNAPAADIKTALEAIVQDSQKELEKNGKQPQVVQTPPPYSRFGRPNPNNIRAKAAESVNNASVVTSVSDADRGMIRGKVLILADERSNKLIIVTSKANMDFFDKVIEELDIETTPDTVVKVYRLKYADSEDVSDMINDLIGNAPTSKSSGKSTQNPTSKSSTASRSNLTSGMATGGARKSANQRSGEAKAGELSKENTTVLSDKRINGLVVMTNKELVPVVESIIKEMDIKLSQVLIETAIIEVGLGQDVKTGIDWVKGMQRKTDRYQSALGGGGGDVRAVSAATNAAITLIDGVATKLPSIFSPGGAGLNYAVFSERLDLAAVISLSQSDNTSKYIASPIIMTVDNKEAEIEATQARKFLSGYQSNSSGSYYGSSIVPQYEGKDIGIKIKVTPKINPNGTVMLEVEEEYSQVGAKQTIQDPNSKQVDIDTALTRKMSADVLLENNQTVVLGGLTDTSTATSDSGIPILKDIPWIGKYLFGRTSNSETRSELLVFLTPYVLNDAQSAQAEALRRKRSLSDQHAWDDHGWSASELADPVSKKELMRRIQEEWKKQDEERQSRLAIEQSKLERVKKLRELSQEERDLWIKMNKEELDAEAKKELEEKMLDPGSQEDLRKLAEKFRNDTLAAADKEIDSAKKSENERAKPAAVGQDRQMTTLEAMAEQIGAEKPAKTEKAP